MYNFSEEELIELSNYPKAAIQHANKEMTKLLHSGKSLTNPFKFCVAVCERWVADEKQKPQKGSPSKFSNKSESVSKETIQKQRSAQDERYALFMEQRFQKRRERLISLGYIPERMSHLNQVDVLSRDRLSYYSGEDVRAVYDAEDVITINDPIASEPQNNQEWALDYEKAIHRRTQQYPEFAKRCAKFDRNPIWAKLSDVQRNDIWISAHTDDCTCRKNEVAGLIMPDIAKKLVEKIQDDPSFKIKEEARKHHWHTADNLANTIGFQELQVAQRDELVADKIYTDSLPEQIYIDPLDGQWEEI